MLIRLIRKILILNNVIFSFFVQFRDSIQISHLESVYTYTIIVSLYGKLVVFTRVDITTHRAKNKKSA